jgi:23S rRNA (adenine2030-N6)-methyltransferase
VKYRHSAHAGNFADVHKHVALLALLRAMQRKDKGFLYIDTHAGAGAYSLPLSAQPRHEAHQGVALLSAAALVNEELRDYRQAIERWQQRSADRNSYPGSPALACQSLRAQDRAVCCELLPSECRALERHLGGLRRVVVECADGYQALTSRLPPLERRSLILIDPPYEQRQRESEQSRQALSAIQARQSNAVVALWYPIKNEPAGSSPWPIGAEVESPLLRLELWVYPRDARVGLNGSGLLIVNPPYRYPERAHAWQSELSRLLDPEQRGGSSVESFVPSGSCARSDRVDA